MRKKIKIAAVNFGRRFHQDSQEANYRLLKEWLIKCGEKKADITCLPEVCASRIKQGIARPSLKEFSEDIPGKTTDEIGRIAKEYKMYIICPLYERGKKGKVYNTAVLIGRNGEVAGKYRKLHLPPDEREEGISPGGHIPVFDLDFGRIGIMTCYDIYFPEMARMLFLRNVRAIFWPSAFSGKLFLQALAAQQFFYIASSTPGQGAHIVDMGGRIIKSAVGKNWLAMAIIDLEARAFDTCWMEKIRRLREKYKENVVIKIGPEGSGTLRSRIRSKTPAMILEEFGIPVWPKTLYGERMPGAYRARLPAVLKT